MSVIETSRGRMERGKRLAHQYSLSMLSPNPLVSIKVMAILTPSSSSSIRHQTHTHHSAGPHRDQLRRSRGQQASDPGGRPRLTDLDGFDLDTRLDMSFFRGLIDRMRQDLGFAERVDKRRPSGTGCSCSVVMERMVWGIRS